MAPSHGSVHLAGFALAALALVGPASAAPAVGPHLELSVGIAGNYDSNLLQYSDDQLRLFEAGTRPDEFSIRTRDDFISNPYATLNLEQRRTGGRRRALRLHAEGNFHSKNGTADAHSMSIGWREGFGDGRRFAATYYLLPRYYLRQLFDPNAVVAFRGLSKYRRAEFKLQITTLAWTQRLRRNLSGSADYRYESRGYNREFEERSSGTHQVQGQLTQDRLPHRGSVNLGAGYRMSHAQAGSFVDLTSGSVTPLPDVSYHGLVSHLEGGVELARGRRWRLATSARYELESRVFTSDRATDRFHVGRKDIFNAGELDLRLGVGRHWSAVASGRTESNHARLGASSSTSTTGDSGSYRDHQAGLAIEWTGDVWRGGRGPAADEEQ